ncbi:MAG: metal-dependent transcriptional regulator [Clostridiales bacterium]|nr:metal-dependent transcriptional regulator [Clostridiales bacterium]
MRRYESREDYLERILMLTRTQREVRSVDIATSMGVSKPSVSHAMKLLRQAGYITMDEDNLIRLTDSGRELAGSVLQRHMTLARVLMRLGVDEQTAYEDACRMEHDLSEQSYQAILRAHPEEAAIDYDVEGNKAP